MGDIKQKIKFMFGNNKKVLENYFFMTVLQILNSLFFLLLYPYLIRTLGAESYGLYVFALAIVYCFITIINFGFDMPAVKTIAQNIDDKNVKEDILSCVFTAKVYLGLVSLVIFSGIILFIPSLRANWVVFFLCFSQVITHIIFPQWYFQGIQQMRIVTYIQLGFKLLSLPFIFLFVQQKEDLCLFALIVSVSSILGALMAILIIRVKDGLLIHWSKLVEIKKHGVEALPFFASNSMNTIKQQSAVVMLGSFFSMHDVAFYDLAMKIFTVPMVLVSSINNALYPKIVVLEDFSNTVRKILKVENVIGMMIVLFLFFFGKWIIMIMGGSSMSEAYPLLVIISFSVFGQLTVGAICNFIFIPKNKSKYVAHNQLVAFVTFFVVALLGIWLDGRIFMVPLALTLSVFSELIYSRFVVWRKKMLS
ncbi:hypothetical protein SDC9_27771 [bioreactor metagenome]|jgi:PST family polysaccharide transporter|uniref:O-antigen transporter n=1 Tax=bioreactor metagenome TaxID=1076179 RepID=A0A644URZ2_9ZZZZ|nr:oligosaccharide flippase family protein [Paludibacter sp.]